jgi:tRNA (guanosine-2'-O-)-methyltransferase
MTPERYSKLVKVLNRRQPDLTVVMDNVHKAHNLAAIARTCDAVGVFELHAITSQSEMGLRHKPASGCDRWIHLRHHASVDEAYLYLRDKGFRLLAAHFCDEAVDYREVDYTQPTAIVVGAELDGITEKAVAMADGSVIIPMVGMVQSLNVSVATALMLFEAYRQRQAAGFYNARRLDEETYRRTLFEWCYPEVADYCNRKGIPYPELNQQGEIVKPLLDLSLGRVVE